MAPDQRNDEAELDTVAGPASNSPEDGILPIWPMVATMDYMLVELRELSPMSAHFLRMARQNLLDEFFARKARKSRPSER